MKNSITRFAGRTLLKAQKYSPEMLVTAGVITMAGAVYMGIKTSHNMKCEEIIAKKEEDYDKIQEAITMKRINAELDYSEEEAIQDKKIADMNYMKSMAKLYAPTVGVTILGAGLVLGGFNVIRKRYSALGVAYTVLDSSFKKYRSRVIDEIDGKARDEKYMYGVEREKIGTDKIQNEDGTTSKVDVFKQVLKGEPVSGYARIFDAKSTRQWVDDPAYNWMYIKKKRDYLNDILHTRGHVFLSEVYDALGFKRTPESTQVGWLAEGMGGVDGYIDFGPWCESLVEVERAGRGGTILVDFNVDGPIWNKI